MVKLDLKDRKILYELDLNSRQSFGKLAKKVGLSKNAVSNRVSNLVNDDVITSFKTLVNFGKLGYLQFNFYFDLKKINLEKEKEMIDFLCKQKIVSQVNSMDGIYNLNVEIITKDITKVYSLWEEIFEKYVNFIDKRLLTILTKNFYYYRPYLLDLKNNSHETLITSPYLQEKIDNLDYKILGLILKASRISVVELSEKLKVTPKTIIAHMKSLIKRKIISGYNLSIDLDKIGYQRFKLLFVLSRVTDSKEKEFLNYVKANPNIVYDQEVVGGEDYELELEVRDISELRKIIMEMQSKFPGIIQDYKILHVYKRYKGLKFLEDM